LLDIWRKQPFEPLMETSISGECVAQRSAEKGQSALASESNVDRETGHRYGKQRAKTSVK
jgi:hypothetical protein